MVVGIERFGATGGASSSPTKSERDSAGLGGLVRIGSNPSGSRPNFFGRQHLTFDKGGKFSAGDSAENLIDGADGEQSPPSRLGIVSES